MTKPLIANAHRQESELVRFKMEIKERTKNLKILFAMIRSPKMSNMVFKAERVRLTQKELD